MSARSTLTIEQLDAMPSAEAAFKLAACCGSSAWIAGMVEHRPFVTRGALFAASDEVSQTLHHTDWLEAFSHHPRIGEKQAAAAVQGTAQQWSAGEQAAATAASRDVQAELVKANQEYEKRFGFIFIISAAGRTVEEILAALRERMGNEPDAEIFIAAREQQKITKLRLEKLVPPTESGR